MEAAIDRYAAMTRQEVETMTGIMPTKVIAWAIVNDAAVHIRDVAGGEPAYHYTSGNFGPGYVSIKNTVGYQKLFKFLCRQLALRLVGFRDFNFIAGLVTGGVPPSMYVRDYLQELQGREIPWVYIRDTRKKGGTQEQITGILHLATDGINPEIPEGSVGVVMEELTNYSHSITNGAEVLRNSGYLCHTSFSILDYDQPQGREALRLTRVTLQRLIALQELLDAVEEVGAFPQRLVDDYRWFQRDSAGWMAHYGYERKEHSR